MSQQCCAKWSSTSPYNGGPFPTRLWSRGQTECFTTNNNITKNDIEMRRKAEVLFYKNNTNKLTKKQQFAKIAKGINPYKNQQWEFKNTENCNVEIESICNPSSASNVPGNQQLCYNRNIPLVNYVKRRQYSAGGTKFPQSTTGIELNTQTIICE